MRHVKIAIWSVAFAAAAVLLAGCTQPVFAQTVVFSDDFSQGLGKWQPTRDDGTLWQVVNGQASVKISRPSYLTELVPKDQYWPTTPLTNFSYELDFTPVQGVDRNISFVYQNTLNWYELHFVDTFFNVVRLKDGLVKFDVSIPYTLQNGQTYHLQINFYQGKIQIYLNGTKLTEQTDPSYNNVAGKIGLKAGTGSVFPTEVRFDNVVVKELPPLPIVDGTQLDVGLLKQTDPAWKTLEYDTASKWSDRTTIERWGCALTSLVMVLKYHQILQLPDGQSLTPATLNDWLKAQPDGYIGEGAINWLAVTRLTQLINQVYGTVKLEYSVLGASLASVKNEILANRPVILQIAGHFLVGSGVTASGQDIHIKDPAYRYTLFSQHHADLLSVRKFLPSHTDLSYFLLASSANLQATFYEAGGLPMLSEQRLNDQINDPTQTPSAQTPALTQTIVPKPPAGMHQLEITQASSGPYRLQLFLYDQAANVTKFESMGLLGSRPRRYTLFYSKTGPSRIKPVMSWTQFRQDLALAKQLKHFNNYWLFDQLDRVAQVGATAAPSLQPRYLAQLQAYLKQSGNQVTLTAQSMLDEDLRALQSE
jgi:hypothetical protein